MTFTQIVKGIFKRDPKAAVNNAGKGGVKMFLSKISGAFMLPVSIMAIAGLFLGVGAAFEAHTDAKTFGKFIKLLGEPIFGAMPLLFMVAIVISFTDDIGTAVFTGIVAFLVFNAIQGPFIEATGNGNTGKAYFLSIKTSDEVAGAMYKIAGSNMGIASMNTSIFGGIVVGFITSFLYKRFHKIELPAYISFFGGKRFVPLIAILAMIPLSFLFLLIWPWIGLGLAYFGKYSGKVAGLDSFVFGFVERSLIPFGLHHVFYAPLWWTAAGGDVQETLKDFYADGGSISHINGGAISENSVAIDSLKNMIKVFNESIKDASGQSLKALTDLGGIISGVTGNHVVLGADGQLSLAKAATAPTTVAQVAAIKNAILATLGNAGATSTMQAIASQALDLSELLKIPTDLNSALSDAIGSNAAGDSFGWLAVNGSGVYEVTFKPKGGAAKTLPIFEFLSDEGLRLGRFMQGKFAFMQLALPAAGAAMVMAAPKENRKSAMAMIIPASVTSFVTGVTEPIEFTFLFLAPWLYWGFHALMAAFSFLFMNLLGAHVGMTFSGGIIDTIVYGAIPFKSGTNFYWMYVIGVIYAPIYYFVFYYAIKKFDLATPGRGTNSKLFTKADYKAKKASTSSNKISTQGAAFVKASGGWSNITKFTNCASRLRWDVKDMSKVNEKAIKAAGANGIRKVGKNHIQIIVGTKAESINNNIVSNKGSKI